MIRIDKQEVFPEVPEVTVWAIMTKSTPCFTSCHRPRRIRYQNGQPVFKCIKYRLPVDRPDGRKGGGFAFFDSEIVVPDDQMQKVTALLQDRINKRHTAAKAPWSPPKVQFGTIDLYPWHRTAFIRKRTAY